MRVLRLAVRLLLTTLGILTVVAILLGRHGLKPATPRQAAFPRYRPVSSALHQKFESEFRLRDIETGATERIRLDEADRIEYAVCSPWLDSQGRSHVTGLWKCFEGAQVGTMGLVRIAVPGGEVLDRVALDTVPGSSPCWSPGMSAKILFSGWDGQLYRYSFDDPPRAAEESDANGARKPIRLAWRKSPPWDDLRLFWEPTWPTDPRLGGRVIVSVSFYELGPDRKGRTRTQLWWLKLDDGGTEVVDMGRLIVPGPTDSILEERLANVTATPDGGLALACLVRPSEDRALRLRLGPVTIDPATGHPSVNEADMVELPGSRLASQPEFSADGGWVDSALGEVEAKTHDVVERYAIVAALTGHPVSGTKTHARLSDTATTTARPTRDRSIPPLDPLKVRPGRRHN